MANMTFKANLLPNTNLGYNLGSSDLRWNIYGNLTGNAATATKLQTARNINGTAFDGTANITTANWGTARTLTIGATGKSVNGSANVSWSKTEIIGSGNTSQFLRGDHAWTNTLTGTFVSTGSPGFQNNTAAGTWSYLRLHNGSNYWDIATNSTSYSGALDFRPGGSANIGPKFYADGHIEIPKNSIWIQGGSAAGNNTNRMTLTSGMPTGLQYNSSQRGTRIFSNAIAFADPYNGNTNNDSGWIRHIEESANAGILELAVGDDGNEQIVTRQYNTSSAIVREAYLLNSSGATTFPVSVTSPYFYGALVHTATGVSYISGAQGVNAAVYAKKASGSVWRPAVTLQTAGGGAWQIGNYNDETLEFQYATKANIDSSTNSTSEIYMQNGDTGRVLTSGNYTNYTVTKTGGGASGTWGINISGNAVTCNYPAGFSSRSTNATWGNQTGATVTCWNESAGGSIDFRNNNPSSGKLSVKVDGRFYGNEGTYPAMLMNYTNSYWGMGDPDAASNVWIRTTSYGIIPYQSGSFGSGHGSLGTSSWYFSNIYADNHYGRLCGWLSNTSHSIGLSNSTWTASNPWNMTNKTLVWGQRGANTSYSSDSADLCLYYGNTTASGGAGWFLMIDGGIYSLGGIYGAVWNDYAEYRKDNPIEKEKQEPGRCVREIGDGALALTTKRLERGCEIISDTFGFAIGQDEENGYNTPIASSGRVLAYPYESIEEFKKHIGYCVCSGPNGTVSIMTDEEEEKYPGRIIGTISEIPTYEEWGTGKVKVNGRVWIRIR